MAIDEFSYSYAVGVLDALAREEKRNPWSEELDKDAFDSYEAGYAWGLKHKPWCGFYDAHEVGDSQE